MRTHCPICGESELVHSDSFNNLGYLAEIYTCRNCLLAINQTAYQTLQALAGDIHSVQMTGHYDTNNVSASTLRDEININLSNLLNLCTLFNFNPSNNTFLDFLGWAWLHNCSCNTGLWHGTFS
jgi:hypothetical protein